jgi:glutamate racemase
MSSALMTHGYRDVFTLSSTHLPWLRSAFEEAFPELLFLDPAEEAVTALAPYVTQGRGEVSCVVTASDKYSFGEFEEMLRRLGIPLVAELIE